MRIQLLKLEKKQKSAKKKNGKNTFLLQNLLCKCTSVISSCLVYWFMKTRSVHPPGGFFSIDSIQLRTVFFFSISKSSILVDLDENFCPESIAYTNALEINECNNRVIPQLLIRTLWHTKSLSGKGLDTCAFVVQIIKCATGNPILLFESFSPVEESRFTTS